MIEEHEYKTASFNTIVVIESLRPEDTKTASALYVDQLRRREVYYEGTVARHYTIPNKAMFLKFMDDIVFGVRWMGGLPLLHIDMHGNTEGVQFTSGEFLSYPELIKKLQTINKYMRNNLVVCLTACSSASLVRYLNIMEGSPFWGLVAPMNEARVMDVVNFNSFYEAAFSTYSMVHGIAALNSLIEDKDHWFVFMNSEEIFEKVWDDYVAGLKDKEKREARIDEIVRLAERENRGKQPLATPSQRRQHARDILMDRLDLQRVAAKNVFQWEPGARIEDMHDWMRPRR